MTRTPPRRRLPYRRRRIRYPSRRRRREEISVTRARHRRDALDCDRHRVHTHAENARAPQTTGTHQYNSTRTSRVRSRARAKPGGICCVCASEREKERAPVSHVVCASRGRFAFGSSAAATVVVLVLSVGQRNRKWPYVVRTARATRRSEPAYCVPVLRSHPSVVSFFSLSVLTPFSPTRRRVLELVRTPVTEYKNRYVFRVKFLSDTGKSRTTKKKNIKFRAVSFIHAPHVRVASHGMRTPVGRRSSNTSGRPQ